MCKHNVSKSLVSKFHIFSLTNWKLKSQVIMFSSNIFLATFKFAFFCQICFFNFFFLKKKFTMFCILLEYPMKTINFILVQEQKGYKKCIARSFVFFTLFWSDFFKNCYFLCSITTENGLFQFIMHSCKGIQLIYWKQYENFSFWCRRLLTYKLCTK